MVHYDAFGRQSDPPRTIKVPGPKRQRDYRQSGAARIGNISFWAAMQKDQAEREAEQRRGLLDRLTRLSVQPTARELLRNLCAQVKPETWPFGRRTRTPGSAPERWDEEDLPAVALVIAVFHDAYCGGPSLLTRELQEICEKVARARFVLDDLNPMILHLEHHLQDAGSARQDVLTLGTLPAEKDQAQEIRSEEFAHSGGRAKQLPGRLSGEAKALAVLAEHPDWTDKRIAEEAGVSRTTLYRYPKFREARKLIQEQGKAALPKGYQKRDGDIEAL